MAILISTSANTCVHSAAAAASIVGETSGEHYETVGSSFPAHLACYLGRPLLSSTRMISCGDVVVATADVVVLDEHVDRAVRINAIRIWGVHACANLHLVTRNESERREGPS